MTRRIAATIVVVLLTWLPAAVGADTCAGASCPGRPTDVAGHPGHHVQTSALNGTGGGRLLVFVSVAVGLATFGAALTVIARRRRALVIPSPAGASSEVLLSRR